MKDFKLKSRVQMLKESIQIDPRFNINPILQEYLVDDFPVNNFFDYKYSGKKIRLQFTGKDADKAQYHFVAANGESITFDEEMMLKHILNNVLIPEVNPKIKEGEEFGENNTLDKKTLVKPEKHDDKVTKSKFKAENEKDKSKFKAENEKVKKEKFTDLEDKNKPVIEKDKNFKAAQKISESLEGLFGGPDDEESENPAQVTDDTTQLPDDGIPQVTDDTNIPQVTDDTTQLPDDTTNQITDDQTKNDVLNPFIDAIKDLTNISIIEFSDENSEYPHVKFNVTDSENIFELAYLDDQIQLITISPEDIKVLTDPQELIDHLNSLNEPKDSLTEPLAEPLAEPSTEFPLTDLPVDTNLDTNDIDATNLVGEDDNLDTDDLDDEDDNLDTFAPGIMNESLSSLFELEDLSKLKKEDLDMFNSLKREELVSLWSGGKIDKSKGFDEVIEALIDVKGFKEFIDSAATTVFAAFSNIDERTFNKLNKDLALSIAKSGYEKLKIEDFDDYFDNYTETVSEDPKHTESKSDLKDQFVKASLKKLNSGADLKGLDALAYIELNHDQATKLIEFLNYNKLGISIKKK